MTINIVQGRGNRFFCINCHGVETVLMNTREDMYKHLEEFHGWLSEEMKRPCS